VLLFSLLASGQVKLRRIDGWQDLAHVLSQYARQIKKQSRVIDVLCKGELNRNTRPPDFHIKRDTTKTAGPKAVMSTARPIMHGPSRVAGSPGPAQVARSVG